MQETLPMLTAPCIKCIMFSVGGELAWKLRLDRHLVSV